MHSGPPKKQQQQKPSHLLIWFLHLAAVSGGRPVIIDDSTLKGTDQTRFENVNPEARYTFLLTEFFRHPHDGFLPKTHYSWWNRRTLPKRNLGRVLVIRQYFRPGHGWNRQRHHVLVTSPGDEVKFCFKGQLIDWQFFLLLKWILHQNLYLPGPWYEPCCDGLHVHHFFAICLCFWSLCGCDKCDRWACPAKSDFQHFGKAIFEDT